MESRRAVADQSAEQHGDAVAGVVLRGEGRRLLRAVPVEGGSQNRLAEIGVRQPVSPLALPLEAARDRAAAQRLLVPAHFVQLGVAEQDVPDNQGHFGDEVPVLVGRNNFGFFDDAGQVLAGVAVEALSAVGPDPLQGLFGLFAVVDAQLDAAQDFDHVHPFGADAEVFLEDVGVAVAARDAHRHGAEVHVRLVLHPADGDRASREAQDLLRHVGRHRVVGGVLHVMPVDAESRQAALGVGRHDGGQIHRTRALGPVQAPDRLDGGGVHVEGLGAVAPAGRDRKGRHDVLGRKLLGAGGGFGAAADGRIGNHDLHRRAVRILQVLGDQLLGIVRHAHGLVFKALADAAPAAVDDGADADFWIQHYCSLLSVKILR